MLTFAGRMPVDPTNPVVELNGGPGIAVSSGRASAAAISLHLVDGVVNAIHLGNPEKLTGLRER
ncbi:hypothetical protein [Micromonospora sp. NPDC047730]|uniref:hypothetical protein n=1 Tax=unclassified Micromonospora TaxID=2617518 RepID=UPI003722FC0A